MANAFDQFDDPSVGGNAFDQFDEPQQDGIVRSIVGDTSPGNFARQGGLTARHAAEGVTALPAMAANLVAAGMNKALQAAGVDYQFPDQARLISETLSEVGLPEPEGGLERVVGDASQALTAGGTFVAGGKALANAAGKTAQGVGDVLAAAPGTQAIAETTAAGVSGVAREQGASPAVQGVAGLTAGIVAPFAPTAAKTTANAASGIRDIFTSPGQRRIVGDILQDKSLDASKVRSNLKNAPETLTDQTTAPLSKDTGLLTLERTLRASDTSGRMSAQASAANAKRHEILDVLGGGDVVALRAARDETTGAAREAALSASDGKALDITPITNRIDALLQTPAAARKAVRNALRTTRKDLEGVTDARTLYEARKDVNDAMQGKFRNPKRSDFKMAKRELKVVKNAIDNEIEKVAPGFKKYIDDYAKLSQWIDQKEIIQNIQKNARMAAPDVTTGRDVLSQAQFRRAVQKERAAGDLSNEQLNVLDAISQDLDLGQAINASGIRPQGSDTAQNLTVAHVIGRTLGGQSDNAIINTLARPVKWISSFSEDQIQGLLTDAMLDPILARQLLQDATPRNMQTLSKTLRQVSNAAVAGLAAEETAASRAPMQ